MPEDIEESTQAVQDLIDSAEVLKQLHDQILAQIEKFDELAEKITGLRPPAE